MSARTRPPVARLMSVPSRTSQGVAMKRSMALRRDVEAVRLDVDEHWPRADAGDGASGGEKSVRTGDDFIAGADVERHQRDQQRIGAGRDADAELAARVGSSRRFECLHFRAPG